MARIRTGFLPAPGLDYDAAFAAAERYGLDHIEVYAEGKPWRSGELSEPDRVRDRLDDHGLDLTAHLPFPLDIGSPMPAVREGALQALEGYVADIAARGGEKAVLHPSAPSRGAANWSAEDVQPVLLESVQAAVETGESHGVEICVENLPSSAFTIDEFDRVFAETDASMTLDTGHAALSGWSGAEMAAFVREHDDRVSHVHLNDNRASGNGWRSDDEHLPFGAGTVDFEAVLSPATAGDWTPTLTMEIVTWDDGYVETSTRRLHDLLGR